MGSGSGGASLRDEPPVCDLTPPGYFVRPQFRRWGVAQSLAQIYLHIVFSTKNRHPFLQDPVLRDELFQYLGGVARNQDSPSLGVGGVADHVHLLCRLSRQRTVSDLVRELKRDSSKW